MGRDVLRRGPKAHIFKPGCLIRERAFGREGGRGGEWKVGERGPPTREVVGARRRMWAEAWQRLGFGHGRARVVASGVNGGMRKSKGKEQGRSFNGIIALIGFAFYGADVTNDRSRLPGLDWERVPLTWPAPRPRVLSVRYPGSGHGHSPTSPLNISRLNPLPDAAKEPRSTATTALFLPLIKSETRTRSLYNPLLPTAPSCCLFASPPPRRRVGSPPPLPPLSFFTPRPPCSGPPLPTSTSAPPPTPTSFSMPSNLVSFPKSRNAWMPTSAQP